MPFSIDLSRRGVNSLSRRRGSNSVLIKEEISVQARASCYRENAYSLSGSPGTFLKCLRCQRLFSQNSGKGARPFPREDFHEFVSAVFSTLESDTFRKARNAEMSFRGTIFLFSAAVRSVDFGEKGKYTSIATLCVIVPGRLNFEHSSVFVDRRPFLFVKLCYIAKLMSVLVTRLDKES